MPPKRTRPGNAKTSATKRRKIATDNKKDRHLDIEEGESYSINTITAANQAGPQPLRSFCDSLGLHLPASINHYTATAHTVNPDVQRCLGVW